MAGTGTPFTSPVMRLIQGGMQLQLKKNRDKTPKLDKNGQPVYECFFAGAIPKKIDNGAGVLIDNPDVGEFYAIIHAKARECFPHLFKDGTCSHQRFAWKMVDGDGRDDDGEELANKPGFAGNWVFKFATRYAPQLCHYGKYDPRDRIVNIMDATNTKIVTSVDDIIKKGYFIRVAGTVDGNGVAPGEKEAVPGMYLSPNLVELVYIGDVIIGGPDAAAIFGAAPPITRLPPGATPLPAGGVASGTPLTAPPTPTGLPVLPGASTPALPQTAGPVLPQTSMPALPGAVGPALPTSTPALPVLPTAAVPQLPVVPAGPQYIMQPTAMGATREALHAQGWSDELLVQHGHMVIA